jgi:hypothetical protein
MFCTRMVASRFRSIGWFGDSRNGTDAVRTILTPQTSYHHNGSMESEKSERSAVTILSK